MKLDNAFRSNKTLFLIVTISIIALTSCNSSTEKTHNRRNNIADVNDMIKEIDIEDVMIGSTARLYIMDKYLIICDHKSMDKLIHIFDKSNFNYITSVGYVGQGPDDITILGHVGVNERRNEFYVSDHGKLKILSYNIDSVLTNENYSPETKISMNKAQFPDKYQILDETTALGIIIEPTGSHEFNQLTAVWNMQTGEIVPMKYIHPDISNKRITIAASVDEGIYVECYSRHDLMSICDLEGNLLHNVYGNNWSKDSDETHHYGFVEICGDKIFASYSGGNRFSDEYYPTLIHVYDTEGDYIKTLDIGYRISHFCYDKQNNRLVFNFEDIIQFGYLQLEEETIL